MSGKSGPRIYCKSKIETPEPQSCRHLMLGHTTELPSEIQGMHQGLTSSKCLTVPGPSAKLHSLMLALLAPLGLLPITWLLFLEQDLPYCFALVLPFLLIAEFNFDICIVPWNVVASVTTSSLRLVWVYHIHVDSIYIDFFQPTSETSIDSLACIL